MMILIDAVPNGRTMIGRLGENDHRGVRFPSAAILAMYPTASVTVLHKRPGDPAAYPVDPSHVRIEDGRVIWEIKSSDLSAEGTGQAELIYTQGTVIAKTEFYLTQILPALDGSGTPPEPWESWISQVVAAGEHAPTIRDGVWYAWDTTAEEYVNTEVPATGNGIASITLNQDYTLTITYTDGNSTTTGSIRGAKGEPGDDYVITQQDYAEIAAIVEQDEQFTQKVQAAEDAAEDAKEWATGLDKNGNPVPPTDEHYENNAKHWAEKSEEYKNAAAELVGDLATEATLQAVEDETETAVELLRQIAEEGQSAGDLNGYSLSRGAGEEVVMTYTDPETAESATIVMITNTTGLAIAAALEDEAKIWKEAVENAS